MKEIQNLIFRNFLKIFTCFIIVMSFFYILSPFLMSILLGGILAMAYSAFVENFVSKGMTRKKAMIIMTSTLVILVLGPVSLFVMRGSKAVGKILASKEVLIEMTQKIEARISGIVERTSYLYDVDTILVREKIMKLIIRASDFTFASISNLVTQIPDLLLVVFITFLSFYFFLVNEKNIRQLFNRYFYFSVENGDKFVLILKSSCREIFVSNVITGVIQALIVSIGALACQIGDFYLIFISTFICSFIPVIGAAPMAFFIALLAGVDHRYGALIVMCIVGIISGVSDNILRPYLVSRGEVEVPGVIGLLCIIGGVIVMGLPGLFIGPLLASLFFGVVPIIVDEYFTKDD
jgi:predicted PurR-regulated permease PerM